MSADVAITCGRQNHPPSWKLTGLGKGHSDRYSTETQKLIVRFEGPEPEPGQMPTAAGVGKETRPSGEWGKWECRLACRRSTSTSSPLKPLSQGWAGTQFEEECQKVNHGKQSALCPHHCTQPGLWAKKLTTTQHMSTAHCHFCTHCLINIPHLIMSTIAGWPTSKSKPKETKWFT